MNSTKTTEINVRKETKNGNFIDQRLKGRSSVGYLRASTGKQKNEKNNAAILQFANEQRLGHVTFVEETVIGTKDWRRRALGELLNELSAGDTLVVSELSRLGRSMLGILEVFKVAQERKIKVYAIKGSGSLNNTIQRAKWRPVSLPCSPRPRESLSACAMRRHWWPEKQQI